MNYLLWNFTREKFNVRNIKLFYTEYTYMRLMLFYCNPVQNINKKYFANFCFLNTTNLQFVTPRFAWQLHKDIKSYESYTKKIDFVCKI